MSQNLLLAALKDNDPKAMDQLFEHYWEMVFDTAFKKLGDEAVAQDITQEIFISLWENRATLSLETSLSAYLYGAVKFRVINYIRGMVMRAGHHTELSVLLAKRESMAADGQLMLQDLNKQVEQALACLPERMKLMVSMSRKQEKSVKEIAAELGLSVQTVKNQITAAMKILRENFSYIMVLAFLWV